MRTMTRKAVLPLILMMVGVAGRVEAQQGWWGGFSYQAAMTTGTTTNFVDASSWRNVGLDGRLFMSSNTSLGLFVGLNVFHDDAEGLVSLGGVDVSGRQWRYINAYPILLTGHYYLGGPGRTRAYAGVGLGTYYIKNRLDVGLSSLTDSNWHFGLAPEVGMTFGMGPDFLGSLSVKYNRAFETGGVERSYWTIGIGLGQIVAGALER